MMVNGDFSFQVSIAQGSFGDFMWVPESGDSLQHCEGTQLKRREREGDREELSTEDLFLKCWVMFHLNLK